MPHVWPSDTDFALWELDVLDRDCPACGRMMHICDHRYRHFFGSSVPKCEAEGFLGVWANSLPGLSCRFDSQTVSGDGIVIHPLGPDRTRTVASVTIDIVLSPGVEVT